MPELSELAGTRWAGTSQLWLDPLGDSGQVGECTMSLSAVGVEYTWAYEGVPHRGSVVLAAGSAEFRDTWHQPDPMECRYLPDSRGLFCVLGSYGPEGDWGWRMTLSLRPHSGELVLQMTNIAPWGEEARAVRMVCVPEQ